MASGDPGAGGGDRALPAGPHRAPATRPPVHPAPLSEISASRDLAYRDPLSLYPGAGALLSSIERRGILTPVVLFDGERGLQAAAGFRRLEAARQLGLATVPALLRGEGPAALFLEAVEEQAGQELNLREKARAVAVAHQLGWPVQRIAAQLCPALGVQAHRGLVDKLLKLREIPAPLFDSFVAKGFSLRQCLPYCSLDPAEGEQLARIAAHLGLGSRRLERATAWLLEISRREELPLARVVEELAILAPFEPGQQARAQRTALGRLERRRMPESSARRQEVERLCGELGGGLRVAFDPTFAAESIEVALRVHDLGDLERARAELGEQRVRRILGEILERLAC